MRATKPRENDDNRRHQPPMSWWTTYSPSWLPSRAFMGPGSKLASILVTKSGFHPLRRISLCLYLPFFAGPISAYGKGLPDTDCCYRLDIPRDCRPVDNLSAGRIWSFAWTSRRQQEMQPCGDRSPIIPLWNGTTTSLKKIFQGPSPDDNDGPSGHEETR
jgi:hypothetical protein